MKQFFKQSILKGLDALGANRFFRWKTRHRLLGLCYHAVLDDDAPWGDTRTRIAVSRSRFEFQMKELRRYWRPISLAELDRRFQTHEPIPERSVFVTFDDGYENNLTVAQPILERYEIPATVFLTTGLIGTDRTIWPLELHGRILDAGEGGVPLPEEIRRPRRPKESLNEYAAAIVDRCKALPHERCREFLEQSRLRPEPATTEAWQRQLYRMLDWSQVRRLRELGVDIGAHTVDHANLARLPIENAREEMRRSKEIIEEHLGIDCFSIAYPFGDENAFSDDVIRVAGELGFRLAVTLCLRRNASNPDPLRLDRLCVTSDLTSTSFRALVSGIRNAR